MMMFIFVRHALVFCAIALALALCADLLLWLTLIIVAHFSGSGVGFFTAKRSGWLGLFALWWTISFLVALPLAERFAGLPFRRF